MALGLKLSSGRTLRMSTSNPGTFLGNWGSCHRAAKARVWQARRRSLPTTTATETLPERQDCPDLAIRQVPTYGSEYDAGFFVKFLHLWNLNFKPTSSCLFLPGSGGRVSGGRVSGSALPKTNLKRRPSKRTVVYNGPFLSFPVLVRQSVRVTVSRATHGGTLASLISTSPWKAPIRKRAPAKGW